MCETFHRLTSCGLLCDEMFSGQVVGGQGVWEHFMADMLNSLRRYEASPFEAM
jgi:hypothetical protein